MRITDAAVQAAAKCYAERVVSINDTFSSLAREMLTASLPHLPLGYEVKKLEWVERRTKDGRKQWQANGEAITETHSEWYGIKGFRLFNLMETHPTLEQAKAAAQADFERRVQECIVAKPVDVAAVRRQAFEEAANSLDDLVNYWKSLPSFNRAYAMRSTIKTADDFRALSAEPAQGEQWRDMNDAPKDGTKIDVWMMPHGYRETDVFWSDIQDAWCRESEYPDEPTPLSVVPYPAFWMPLPAAPNTEAAE